MQILGWLLSVAAWLQVSRLSGFSVRQVARAAHAAIIHGLSGSPHDHQKTVKYMYYIVHPIPVPKCSAINMTLQWLTKNAHWRAASYNSWTLIPSMSPDGTTSTWNHNASLLHDVQDYSLCYFGDQGGGM